MSPTGWSETAGYPPHAVLVFENLARKGVLYLRAWNSEKGNWEVRSLRRPLLTQSEFRDAKGKPLAGKKLEEARQRAIEDGKQWAREQAEAWYLERSGKVVPAAPAPAPAPERPLGILAGLAKALDPDTGKYPRETPYRRKVVAAVHHAASAWGGDFPWELVRLEQWEKFWRGRIRAVRAGGRGDGLSEAIHATAHVATVAQWLRDRQHITGGGVLPSKWRDEIRADYARITGESLPEVKQPRHTADEMRRIFAQARETEPRLNLALALGGHLRGGQVMRAWRSALVLEGPEAGAFGTFKTLARGTKKGAAAELTKGQRAAVDEALGPEGYLREYEARYRETGEDYRLFPAGPLTRLTAWRRGGGKPIAPVAPLGARGAKVAEHAHQRSLARWFRDAEVAAGIKPVKGRGPYGLRRATVDAALVAGISPDALAQLMGHADDRMAKKIYRDKELVLGRTEARDVLAKIRGEAAPEAAPKEPAP